MSYPFRSLRKYPIIILSIFVDDGIIEITPDINSDYDEFTEDDILPCTYEEESDNLK